MSKFGETKNQIKKMFAGENARHITVLLIFLIVSKGLGFVRQVLIYQRMDPASSDLLFAALKIPNLITTLLLTGTIVTSVLPILSRIESRSENSKNSENSSKYLNLILFALTGLITAINIIVLIFTKQFLELTTSSQILDNFQKSGVLDDYINITRILLLSPLGLGAQSIFGVFLTLKKRFAVYSWAGIIYNLGTIIGILIAGYNGIYQASWGMMLGVWLSALLYAFSSSTGGLKLYWPWQLFREWPKYKTDLKATWRTFVPRIFVFNGVLTATFLINLIATSPGQITYFDIGLSIQEVFLTIVTSIATVFFPDLAKLWNRKDLNKEIFWSKLYKYVRIVTLISIFGVISTLAFSPLVVSAFEILGKGQNNGEYIVLIARFSTLSLVFQSINEILSKYFYVRERVWQPVLLSLSGSIAQILAAYLLLPTSLDSGIIVCLSLAVNNFVIWAYSFYMINSDRKNAI